MAGSDEQDAEATPEFGAMTRLGRASVLPPEVTVSDTTVVLFPVRPRGSVFDTCHVVALASGLVKVVLIPSVSASVKLPLTLPVSVRDSEPGSGIQPSFAALAVKWMLSPSAETTSTAVSDTLRR
ncbi:hypothetical protein ACH49_06620 [Streptomyces leeuwenhoekii]|uniref:Uncharacterized protein n=1 Tax=Streptomyces leeuwenhoekii TaxID=1437453 RepID=A0ABR5I2G1_STRLW|nr:hypothetical protein ACH49_06620 [Streptomyces leeuwenhoekii]